MVSKTTKSSSEAPRQGDVWIADLNPTRGREQSGRRPVVIVSVERFNQSPAGLVVAVPVSSVDKGIPWHVRIEAGEGGLKSTSFAKCDDVRSLSKLRLKKRWGRLDDPSLANIRRMLSRLLGIASASG
jgi:mRNA interferase MazF